MVRAFLTVLKQNWLIYFFVLFECLNNKPCWELSVGIQLKVKILTLLQSVGNRQHNNWVGSPVNSPSIPDSRKASSFADPVQEMEAAVNS